MARIETYSPVNDYLSSPLANHIIGYNSPRVVPKSTALPAKTTVATSTVATTIAGAKPQPVVSTAAVEVNGSGIEASLGLNQSVSLTGTANAPATAVDANNPGLNSQPGGMATTGGMMHWGWILLIVAVFIGLIWYYNPGNVLAR